MKTLQQLLMKKRNYRELKENSRMIKSQGNNTEKNNLIEEGESKDIEEVIKQNA